MVVDDQSDIVNVIKCTLEKAKFEACIFTDPLAALFHFKLSVKDHHHFHSVMISDIRMPVMNGYEFIKEVKELDPNTKIILMSSLQIKDNEFLNVLPDVKIDGFIQKPFSVFKLMGILGMYVNK